MKDKQESEEEVFDELDSMYQRVADLERNETPSEQESHLNGYEQAADQAVSTHEQVVSFPEGGMLETPGNLSGKTSKLNRKRSYRPVIIATSFALIILVIIAIIILKTMINPRSSKTGPIHQAMVTAPLATKEQPSESPPVQAKQEAMKSTQEGVEAARTIPQEIMKPENPLTPDRYWAIQVGAFHNLEYLHDLMEELKEEGLDAYWMSQGSNKQNPLYIVFVGHFMDAYEAATFLRDKKIPAHYPDSYVREVSSSENNH